MMNCSLRFRVIGFLLCISSGATALAAQRGSDGDTAEPPAASLRLVVVTDDDFLSPAEGAAWCSPALRRAVETFRELRPGTILALETRFAGAPAILRGGQKQLGPRRAIGFLCDDQGAIAAFCVGVPTGRQLAAMVEDADEVAVLRLTDALPTEQTQDQEHERADRLVEALHARSRGRVLRQYRPLLDQIDRQTPPTVAAARLLPALAADRNERFLVAGVTDGPRWRSAQQHTETMRHWCQAMLPCIVAKPVDSVWQEMAAILWDSQPWTHTPQHADLTTWYTKAIAQGPVVLSVKATRPLLVDQASTVGNDALVQWQQMLAPRTVQLLDQAEHRVVAMPELARLLHHRQDKPVQMIGAAEPFTGWVIFVDQRTPTVVPASAERRFAETMRKLLALP